jgi:DNA (cytosine-5)-methyltransferase 1
MSLGVEQAGFTLRTIIETPGYGKNAATWDLNRPELAHSILELDHNDEYFRQWAPYDLDLLYGNPPCGGMSAQTCSRIESPTNNCMRMWIRMVVKARPKLILMENGYQLATDRMAPLLGDLTGVLEEAGYQWNTWQFYGYQVGTPQVRRRMFLYCSWPSGAWWTCLARTTRLPALPDRTSRTSSGSRQVRSQS